VCVCVLCVCVCVKCESICFYNGNVMGAEWRGQNRAEVYVCVCVRCVVLCVVCTVCCGL